MRGSLADIQARGDAALIDLSRKFDAWAPETFRLSDQEIAACVKGVDGSMAKYLVYSLLDKAEKSLGLSKSCEALTSPARSNEEFEMNANAAFGDGKPGSTGAIASLSVLWRLNVHVT